MRFLLILALGLFLNTASFAQVDSEEIQQGMEKMTKEMQEQLKHLNLDELKIDTLLLKNFKFPEGFNAENFIMPNDLDMNSMLKMMELQMKQLDVEGMTKIMEQQMKQIDIEGMAKMMEENMSKMDFSEIEKMLGPLMNGEMFVFPSPEDLENEGENNKDDSSPKKEKKKTKKKKSYKM